MQDGLKEIGVSDVVQDIAEAAVKKIIYEVILKKAVAKVISALPFLGLPFINPVFVWAMEKLAATIYEELSTFVAFKVISFKTTAQREAYESAVAQFKDEVLRSEQNAEEIERRRQEVERALRDLVNFPTP